MLEEIFTSRPFREDRLDQLAGGVELMVAGKDEPHDLFLLIPLGDEIAADDLQPAFPLQHFFPEVSGAMAAFRIGGVAGRAAIALIEGQKTGFRAGQLGRHVDFHVADGEVDQGTARKGEKRLYPASLALAFRVAVEAVLVDGVVNGLGVIGLEFGGGDRDAVEVERQVETVIALGRVIDLADHPQPVGGVFLKGLRVHGQGRFELREQQRLAQADHLDAVSQDIEGAAIIQGFPQAIQQNRFSGGSVVFAQDIPGFRLSRLDPGHDIRRKQGTGAVVLLGSAGCVQPAVGGQVFADVVSEVDFFVQGFGRCGICHVAIPRLLHGHLKRRTLDFSKKSRMSAL